MALVGDDSCAYPENYVERVVSPPLEPYLDPPSVQVHRFVEDVMGLQTRREIVYPPLPHSVRHPPLATKIGAKKAPERLL